MNRARKTALAAVRASIYVLVGLLTFRRVWTTPSRDQKTMITMVLNDVQAK